MNKLKDKIMNIQLNTLKKYINLTLLPVLGIFSLLLVSNTVLFCAFDPEYFIEKTMSIVQTLSYQTGKTAIYLAGTYGVLKTLEFGMNVPFLTAKAIAHSPIGFVENHTVSLLGRVFNFQHINGIFLPYSNYEYKYYIFPWYLDPYQIYSRASRQTQFPNISPGTSNTPTIAPVSELTTMREPEVRERIVEVPVEREVLKVIRGPEIIVYKDRENLINLCEDMRQLRLSTDQLALVSQQYFEFPQLLEKELREVLSFYSREDFWLKHIYYFQTKEGHVGVVLKYGSYGSSLHLPPQEIPIDYAEWASKFPLLNKILYYKTNNYENDTTLENIRPYVNFEQIFLDEIDMFFADSYARIDVSYINRRVFAGLGIAKELAVNDCTINYRAEGSYVKKNLLDVGVRTIREEVIRTQTEYDTKYSKLEDLLTADLGLSMSLDKNLDNKSLESLVVRNILQYLDHSETNKLIIASYGELTTFFKSLTKAIKKQNTPSKAIQATTDPGFEETKDEIYNPTTGQDLNTDSLSTTVGAALAVGTIGAATTLPLDQILTILSSSQEITSLFHNPEAVRIAIDFWNAASHNAPLPEILETARQNAFTMSNPQELGDPAQWSVPSETGLHHFSTPTSSSPNYLGIIIGLAALGAIGAGTYYCVKYGIPFTSVTETASAVNQDLSQYLDIK